jgi:hypothetical protein
MNYSDTSSDYSDSDELSSIDNFLESETDNMINLFHDLKSRFPYFLGDRSEIFIQFIIENIFEHYDNNETVDYKFINENYQEINITLNVVNRYLVTRKWTKKNRPLTYSITESNWLKFCYIHTI